MQTALSEISDERLVLLLLNEDQDAFAKIYEKYWKKLLGMAIYKTNDRVVAEEIVQELFVSLWENENQLLFTILKITFLSR